MANDKDRGPHCELGEQLTGVKRLIHEVLMETELYNGFGAYILSYASTNDPDNKSGLTFGANQMDMSKRVDAVKIFKDILENAKDNQGQYIIPRNKINAIKNINCTEIKKTPEQIFGKDLPLINAALRSAYGIQKINEKYLAELNEQLAYVEKAIGMMQNPAAKAFYSAPLGKVFLFEYNNQFGLNLNGSFMTEYIDGKYNKLQRQDYTTHEKYSAPTTFYTLADHIKFIHGTYQYAKTPKMMDTRLAKAENTYNKYYLLAFDEEINLVDMQAEIVPLLDNCEDFMADISHKYTGIKTKTNLFLEDYLSESESLTDLRLVLENFINDEVTISNNLQFLDSDFSSVAVSDNLERDHFIEEKTQPVFNSSFLAQDTIDNPLAEELQKSVQDPLKYFCESFLNHEN